MLSLTFYAPMQPQLEKHVEGARMDGQLLRDECGLVMAELVIDQEQRTFWKVDGSNIMWHGFIISGYGDF
jgi:hypothetical protein